MYASDADVGALPTATSSVADGESCLRGRDFWRCVQTRKHCAKANSHNGSRTSRGRFMTDSSSEMVYQSVLPEAVGSGSKYRRTGRHHSHPGAFSARWRRLCPDVLPEHCGE
jgi:hypothetical protein